jgi:Domain of unknown function (DUF4382)
MLNMNVKWAHRVACGIALASLAACGSGSGSADPAGSGSSAAPTAQAGNVALMVSDAPAQDWALVGVKVESIALVPQGGGSDVTVYSVSAASAPYVNLVELDQLSEILGNVSVPAGTYTGAVITVGGNPGDVLLTTSADPESGFAAAASTPIASQAIQIQHTQGASGNLTVPIDVTFDSPLTVTTNSNNALDLEFDLSNPAFIIAHQPPGAGTLLWAVNFRGPVRHHPIRDVALLTLRQLYGDVTAVASDGSSLTVNRVFRAWPIATPEMAVETQQSLTIDVDSQNGTLFYDVDTKSGPTKITSFANLSGLAANAYVRIQARYQEDGALTATRVWVSSTFNGVWVSPEGHVLDVDANPSGTSSITVTDEAGRPVMVDISNSTNFYFHGGTAAIGTGPAFLANMVRGFKVHVMDVVDPLATPLVAEDLDIETAQYSGALSNVDTTQFTYTHDYVRASDDYQQTLPYISSSTSNGTDGSGNAITGFKYWPFAYPTLVTSGANAVQSFVQATTGLAGLTAYGFTDATWGDPANATGWSAPWVDQLPAPVPLALVANGLSGNQFSITAAAQTYTIDVGTNSGSATLVYQVDRTGGIVTVSPIDITTASGLSTFTQALVAGTPVKVFGVPQSNATLQAYVVIYFTGDTLPMQPMQ